MKIKRVIAWTLAMLLMLSVPFCASAYEIGVEFDYEVEGGKATLTNWKEWNSRDPNALVIPEKIDGYPVVAIGQEVTSVSVNSLSIPASLERIEGNLSTMYFKKVTVAAGNRFFSAQNNVLYDKEKTRLIRCYTYVKDALRVPSTVQTIGPGAFYYCECSSVAMPEGMTEIGEKAFERALISKIILPSGLKKIGYMAFAGAATHVSSKTTGVVRLTDMLPPEIVLPDTVEEIDASAFSNCRIDTVNIPGGVKKIGAQAFRGSGLKSVTIGEGTENIGLLCFYGCKELTGITLPSTLRSIGDEAFLYDEVLKTVALPAGLQQVGRQAFYGCKALTSVGTLGKDLTEIGEGAFTGTKIKNFSVDAENPYFTVSDGVLYNKDMTRLIQYPSGRTGGVSIPEGVQVVGRNSIGFTPSAVKFPASVREVEDVSYINTSNLYYAGTPEEWKDVRIGDDPQTKEYNAPSDREPLAWPGLYKESWMDRLTIVRDNPALKLRALPGNVTVTWTSADPNVATVDQKGNAKMTGYGNTVITATAVLDGQVCTVDFPVRSIFQDMPMPGYWAYDALDYMGKQGFYLLSTDGYVHYSREMSRAEFVSIFARMSGVSVSNKVNTGFSDVPKGMWCAGVVKWASDSGIVSGADGKFMPGAPITREQLCVLMVAYAKHAGIRLKMIKKQVVFTDGGKIASWAKSAVTTCQRAGLVSGKGKNVFDPKGTTTRLEVASLIMNFHKTYMNNA